MFVFFGNVCDCCVCGVCCVVVVIAVVGNMVVIGHDFFEIILISLSFFCFDCCDELLLCVFWWCNSSLWFFPFFRDARSAKSFASRYNPLDAVWMLVFY